eukprot:823494-Alexandrium_andersonii.AAC.1
MGCSGHGVLLGHSGRASWSKPWRTSRGAWWGCRWDCGLARASGMPSQRRFWIAWDAGRRN